MSSIGEELVRELAERGVKTVFGIPGVHTVELYRGLAASGIRHVTPRHEQSAGFMADGYARVSGQMSVAFVITGPGLTNTLTAMAQARADSVPMLVVSGVNRLDTLGKGLGYLHELPDQRGLAGLVALHSERVTQASELAPALDAAFASAQTDRPGPRHIEVPLDVAGQVFDAPPAKKPLPTPPEPSEESLDATLHLLASAKRPVILAGGGVRSCADPVRKLAESLNAPVVQTINARGVLHAHPLSVPASPSLEAVRALIGGADVVLAVGTELGPTDFDMYATGTMPTMRNLIRVDICPQQLARRACDVAIHGDGEAVMKRLLSTLDRSANDESGHERAALARARALKEIGPEMRTMCDLLDRMRETVPGALIVGDSAQPIYAGNLYYDHDRPVGWFNAATGFGALGYAIPAAIGAALAKPEAPVICLTGDGGAQFSLPELMTARDEGVSVIFVIWNNRGYQEIETSMEAVGATPVGCDPTPPDFEAVAASCGLPFQRCLPQPSEFAAALKAAIGMDGPAMIEIMAEAASPAVGD